jgi:hypothetical protein
VVSFNDIKKFKLDKMTVFFKKRISILVAATLFMAACNKKTANVNDEKIESYWPLQTGKYIVYQLDSLVYVNFGTRDTTISYQVKYETEELINEMGSEKTYRMLRYIRKSASQSWTPEAAFAVTQTTNQIRFLENGLHFIKLQSPVSNGFSWKGNALIETGSANSLVRYLDNWTYVYSSVGLTEKLANDETVQTVTVNQRDEVIGQADNPDSYSEINYAQEKYAKGIGMVYRKFLHKEYQPGTGSGGYVAEGSYGITYTMIDHN